MGGGIALFLKELGEVHCTERGKREEGDISFPFSPTELTHKFANDFHFLGVVVCNGIPPADESADSFV